MVAGEGDGGAVDAADGVAVEDGGVVGDEGVAAHDEGEGDLALADAGLAFDEDADAVDVDHGAVDAEAWGGELLEEDGGGVDEMAGDEVGAEDGDAYGFGHFAGEGGAVALAGEDDGGGGAEDGERRALEVEGEGAEVGDLGESEDLHALVGEVLGEAGEGESGAVEGEFADGALVAEGGGGLPLELEGGMAFFVELLDGDAAVDGDVGEEIGAGGRGGGGDGLGHGEGEMMNAEC